MEPQEISDVVFEEKYAEKDETRGDLFGRVAKAIASVEEPSLRLPWEEKFLWAMENGFIPAGRILASAGSSMRETTLINCFVQAVDDCISSTEEGITGIYDALREAAETMRRGGGVGYDFSRIRPRGAWVKGTNSQASGPISYMKVFDRSCETVESAGFRRGAQMGTLRIDHPDIEEFIDAKRDGSLKNFNMSVTVTNEFMNAVKNDEIFYLVHKTSPVGKLIGSDIYGNIIYKTVRAKELWEKIMESTYNHAEPGVLFLDTINQDNNLRYCEEIETVNPCAEEALPPYGCCCLGSINLTKFVRDPFTEKATFDYQAFCKVIAVSVRMLDNVLDLTNWPLEKQRQEAMDKRRIGLGYTGLGDCLMMLTYHYGSHEARSFASTITRELRDNAYMASTALAREKAPFPLLKVEKYLEEGTFASRLPQNVKNEIRAQGIRNSHLLAIAPTGTISLAFADNASNGIEPPFSWTYNRKKRMPDGSMKTYVVEDYAHRLFKHLYPDRQLPGYFVTALELSAEQHEKMVAACAPFIDSAISKTVNVPEDYPYEDFKNLYFTAWEDRIKGIATYRPNSVLGSVLSVIEKPKEEEIPPTVDDPMREIDPYKVRIENRPMEDLKSTTTKICYYTSEGKKSTYIVVGYLGVQGNLEGIIFQAERPIEFFIPIGQINDGQQWITSNMRLLSMVARYGGDIAKALHNMREVVWDKGPVRCGTRTKEDGTIIPMFHDSEVAAFGYSIQQILIRSGFLDENGNMKNYRKELREQNKVLEPIIRELQRGLPTPLLDELEKMTHIVGKKCTYCGAHAVVKRDGCDHCTACGEKGACG